MVHECHFMGSNLTLKCIHVKTFQREIYHPLLSYSTFETSLARKRTPIEKKGFTQKYS